MADFLFPLLKGCFTGGGLIVAIGAQNAFVLKQGLMRNQVLATALFCAIFDSLMIALGVGGLGQILTTNQTLLNGAKWGGAAFLLWYGYRAFRSVFYERVMKLDQGLEKPSLKESFLILSAVSFLNPHVYLDTFVLLGSIGSQFEASHRPFFALGAMLASTLWFFGLSYGARLLTPLFQKQISWKILDFCVGCTMWGIAISLLLS